MKKCISCGRKPPEKGKFPSMCPRLRMHVYEEYKGVEDNHEKKSKNN